MKFKAYFFIALAVMTIMLSFNELMESETNFSKIYNAITIAVNFCFVVYWLNDKELKR